MPNPTRYTVFLDSSAKFRAKVRSLYADGTTQSKIAKRFKVSRQRINQIIHDKAYQSREKTKQAVSYKKLPKPSSLKCVDCGSNATEYDHRDYNKPKMVEPVCKPCNARRGKGKNGISRQRVWQILRTAK